MKQIKESQDGNARLPLNVLASWSAEMIQIVSGFIIPRLISDSLGRFELGVWDFAWSLVSYFSLVQFGMTSSINRFVAQFKSRGDMDGVNRVCSSSLLIQTFMAFCICCIAVACAALIPAIFGQKLEGEIRTAQLLVLILGANIALQTVTATYAGILTGCHRWDLHNLVFAGTYFCSLVGMWISLKTGGGLISIATVFLISEFAGRSARVILAKRSLKGLKIRFSLADRATTKSMLFFGSKNFLPQAGSLLMNQGINIMIVALLGPPALALYSRPRAFITHIKKFCQKYALIYVPMVSSLHAEESKDRIRELGIEATRNAVLFSLPLLIIISILGGDLLEFWMGSEYRYPELVIALVLAHFFHICHLPLLSILSGINKHGLPGMIGCLSSLAAMLLVYIVLTYIEPSLLWISVGIFIPLTIADGFITPSYFSRVCNIKLSSFYIKVWKMPIILNLAPLGLLLTLKTWLFEESMITRLFLIPIYMFITFLIYWKFAFTKGLKNIIIVKAKQVKIKLTRQ